MPAGIEHDYANWEKISTFVGYSLTQARARVKKLVCFFYNFSLPDDAYTLSVILDQGELKVQHQYIFPCTADCALYALSYDGSALCPCSAHGKCCLVVVYKVIVNCFSVRFTLNAAAVKSTGI